MKKFAFIAACCLITVSPLAAQECPGGGHMQGSVGKEMEECHAKRDLVRTALDDAIKELQAVESSTDVNALQRAAAGVKARLSQAKDQVEHCRQVMEKHKEQMRSQMKEHKERKAPPAGTKM